MARQKGYQMDQLADEVAAKQYLHTLLFARSVFFSTPAMLRYANASFQPT